MAELVPQCFLWVTVFLRNQEGSWQLGEGFVLWGLR